MATRKLREVQKIEIPVKMAEGAFFLELDVDPNAPDGTKQIIGRLQKDDGKKVYFEGDIPTMSLAGSDASITITLTLAKKTS